MHIAIIICCDFMRSFDVSRLRMHLNEDVQFSTSSQIADHVSTISSTTFKIAQGKWRIWKCIRMLGKWFALLGLPTKDHKGTNNCTTTEFSVGYRRFGGTLLAKIIGRGLNNSDLNRQPMRHYIRHLSIMFNLVGAKLRWFVFWSLSEDFLERNWHHQVLITHPRLELIKLQKKKINLTGPAFKRTGRVVIYECLWFGYCVGRAPSRNVDWKSLHNARFEVTQVYNLV